MNPGKIDLETHFDPEVAARDIAQYRRRGAPRHVRALAEGLIAEGVAGRSLLDIGGGVGAIQYELLAAGVRSVTDVDGSAAYLDAARNEAERLGVADRISHIHGDIVGLRRAVGPADIVTLSATLCCYPRLDSLIEATAAKCAELYGLAYPHSSWWMRSGASVFAAVCGPGTGPGYVHQEESVTEEVRRAGFAQVADRSTWYWRISIFRRVTGSPEHASE